MTRSRNTWNGNLRRLAAIFAVAVPLNYAWELAQTPFYEAMESIAAIWRHCLRASLGDGLVVLFVHGAGWVVTGRVDWYERLSSRGYVAAAATGLAVAIAIEWLALSTGRWAYSSQMPLVPGMGVGVIPVAQLIVLPPLVFRAVAYGPLRTYFR